MKTSQINKIQQVSHQFFETVIPQSQTFSENVAISVHYNSKNIYPTEGFVL